MSDWIDTVRAARRGDTAAFTRLVREFAPLVRSVCLHRTSSDSDAEDAAQATFMMAFDRMGELKHARAFPRWLRTIAVGRCQRITRAQRREVLVEPHDIEHRTNIEQGSELDLGLRELLDGLEERDRLIASLNWLYGHRVRDIADHLDLGISLVKKSLMNSRNRLKEKVPMEHQHEERERSEAIARRVELFVHVRRNELDDVRRMLTEHPDLVNARDVRDDESLRTYYIGWSGGATPLFWAVYKGDATMIDLLLRHGADVDRRSDHGRTPLMEAVESGRLSLVTKLLEQGADADATHPRTGMTPLHLAARRGDEAIVRRLLDAGASESQPDAGGRTPGDWAALGGHASLAEQLGAESRVWPERADAAPTMIFETGVRAVDLFAPIPEGGSAILVAPPGVGKLVLLFEILHNVHRRGGHVVAIGCDDRLHEERDFAAMFAETNVPVETHVVSKDEFPALDVPNGREVVLAADVRLLPALESRPELAHATRIYFDPWPNEADVPVDVDAIVRFDSDRAGRGVWPAIDTTSTASTVVSDRHRKLALAVREMSAESVDAFVGQPFHVAEAFTGWPGEHYSLDETFDAAEKLVG